MHSVCKILVMSDFFCMYVFMKNFLISDFNLIQYSDIDLIH